MIKTAVTVFLLGFTFGSGLCLASCGPILISYLASARKNPLKSFLYYVLFSLSRVSVYIILSLLIFFLGKLIVGSFMEHFSRYVLLLGGGFIVLIGALTALGKSWKYHKHNIVIMGLVIGLLPCAPLIAVLSYIALVAKTWMHSLIYSILFGIGTFLSPLIILTMLTGFVSRVLPDKEKSVSKIFGYICGFILVFLGLQLMGRGFNA